jgi:hypothetical protein
MQFPLGDIGQRSDRRRCFASTGLNTAVMRDVTLLGARADASGPSGSADAAGVRQAIRQARLDVRLYTYAGAALLAAARLYQGQTTNFRTPRGGFAPVFFV